MAHFYSYRNTNNFKTGREQVVKVVTLILKDGYTIDVPMDAMTNFELTGGNTTHFGLAEGNHEFITSTTSSTSIEFAQIIFSKSVINRMSLEVQPTVMELLGDKEGWIGLVFEGRMYFISKAYGKINILGLDDDSPWIGIKMSKQKAN